MRRLGVALVTAAVLAVGTVTGTATPASAALPALGGCGWQPTLALLNTPDSIRAGTLRLAGFAPTQLDLNPVDPANINWAADPFRDPTWKLWFHSLKWAESLVTSGAGADMQLARGIVDDFLAANPDPGVNEGAWTDHANSFRTSLLVCMWDKGDADVRTWAAPLINLHVNALINRYVGPWNHGIMQQLAMLAAGCALDNAGWRATATSRLAEAVPRSIDAQGAVEEQSTGYAQFIQRLYIEMKDHLTACGQPLPAGLNERIAAVDLFAAQATRPGGTLVELGDTWPDTPSVGMGPYSAWVSTGGAQGTQPTETTKVYNAGYVFSRDSWTNPTQHFTLRFGPGRYIHGHNDHLAMTYWANGRDVLVDSGYAGYADRAFRTWSRSLQAHNVPIVTGAKFSAATSTALVGRSSWRGTETVQLRDRGFGAYERHRTVLVDNKMRLMLVRDDVTGGKTPRGIQVLWHLDPSWRKESVDTSARTSRVTFLSPDGTQRATILQFVPGGQRLPANAAKLYRGRTVPSTQGWVSRFRGDKTPAWVVDARRPAAKSQSVVTLITVTKVGQKVRATWARPNGKDRFRITVGTTTKVYNSTRRGGLTPK